MSNFLSVVPLSEGDDLDTAASMTLVTIPEKAFGPIGAFVETDDPAESLHRSSCVEAIAGGFR
jgi:hypothetical protein